MRMFFNMVKMIHRRTADHRYLYPSSVLMQAIFYYGKYFSICVKIDILLENKTNTNIIRPIKIKINVDLHHRVKAKGEGTK